ncbi:MAG: tRNA (adenosine(37)-N6)-threonylcarbamoyltransferase complex transferase subunit TsaD [Bacteroidota bacterium]|nr:tRNA (adenosine(37)-N6)-threonylcarbamoyltransferase complex transferase subunit TsaD [Candidatus Kapabacteria bacterium]MDW8220213.1 tRNA (adenosine(37)-N6)-threonylcarbamoyltransferase complex transferase subunit TsaD [Bacteroidota bacterium]
MSAFTENSTLLAIETSCDETSAAVLVGCELRSNIVSSQRFHTQFGGVVPELASRAHVRYISSIVRDALSEAHVCMHDVHAIAVTQSPGLAGSLVIGTSFAKGLALRYNVPIIAVNHIEGHIYSACIEHTTLSFPFIVLVVSGGHTALFLVRSFEEYQLLGSTRDDAAGEAFDKIAKLLGLGYPGGAKIDRLAREGNPSAISFPRGMMHDDNFDWSFSGLKTAVRTYLQCHVSGGQIDDQQLRDICAASQEAIVDVLVHKTVRAAQHYAVSTLVVAGGVAANSRLRERLCDAAQDKGWSVFIPSIQYCTDNAAMIGYIGRQKLLAGVRSPLTFTIATQAIRSPYRSR